MSHKKQPQKLFLRLSAWGICGWTHSCSSTKAPIPTPDKQTCLPSLHSVKLLFGTGGGQVALTPLFVVKELLDQNIENRNKKKENLEI